MNSSSKAFWILGLSFIVISMPLCIAFLSMIDFFGVMSLIPLIFVVIGAAFILVAARMTMAQKKIKQNGKRYAAKIYSYVKDTSMTINGAYPVNIKVHYFDDSHTEREAVIPTQFAAGDATYPIGMTMDIFEYQGKFTWDAKSVREEELPGEAELMDDKPVNPELIHIVGVSCPSCGAAFTASQGYAQKCPYCGHIINA